MRAAWDAAKLANGFTLEERHATFSEDRCDNFGDDGSVFINPDQFEKKSFAL